MNIKDEKVSIGAGTLLAPVPAVMVSCGDAPENYNIITIAWTGIINSEPPITYISVRKSRHSHALITKAGGFVINSTTKPLTSVTDYCGVKTGAKENKFETAKLTPIPAEHVKAPLIKESPVNIECKVLEVKEFTTHDMFIAEIVDVHVDKSMMDLKGKLMLDQAGLVAYIHGHYFEVKREAIGRFGFSVMKAKTKKRISREKNIKKMRKK